MSMRFRTFAAGFAVSVCLLSALGCSSGEPVDSITDGLGGLSGETGSGGTGGSVSVGCGPSAGGSISKLFTNVGGYHGTTDTTIDSAQPVTNYGNDTVLRVDPTRRSLLRWDVTSIPTGATVIDACIGLQFVDASNDSFMAYEVRKSWDETTASWLTPWTLGGANSKFDRAGVVVANVHAVSPGPYGTSISAALVQKWVSHPPQNFGLIAINASDTDALSFASSELSATGARPALRVTYQLP